MSDCVVSQAALTYLVDPVVKTELGPWQRSFIIKTLLAQGKNVEVYIVDITLYSILWLIFVIIVFLGESQKALYLMKVMCPTVQSFSDVKLFITVLLASG